MDVTSQLLKVYLVEKQIRGLQTRLKAAEKFLNEQDGQLSKIESKHSDLTTQLKKLQAKAADNEGEMKRLDEKIRTVREQMNTARTNKEYQAFLVEANTFKTERDAMETAALEHMAKVDEVRKQIEEIEAAKSQRSSVKQVATTDRDQRHAEIRERLEELKKERGTATKDVPQDALGTLLKLLEQRGDDAMATIEVHDAKRHEYNCGSCMMALPIEAVAGLMSSGRLTLCASCQCVLYIDDVAKEALAPPAKKGAKASARS